MIISHSRKFIFVKSVKTGGSSLEIVLSKWCSDGDVITHLPREEEKLRAKIGGIRPQNYFVTSENKLVARSIYKPLGIKELLRRRLLKEKFELGIPLDQHTSAMKIREVLGEELFKEYFKFTIIRNPFDRIVSHFFWENSHTEIERMATLYDHDNFDQWLRYHANAINVNWGLYTQGDKPIIDFLVRYENLAKDLEFVSKRIGLEHNIYDDMRLIRAKGDYRPKDASAENILDDTHLSLISVLCREEILLQQYLDGQNNNPMLESPPEK